MLKPVEKPIKFVKNLSTKGKSYPITHVSAVIDDNGESIKSTIDSLKNKSSVTKVTWLELKNKRDAGKLIPGSLYRITDYNCTTTQENTRSAGHQFDIVLLALSENKLAEEGWVMMHDNIYDVTFADGVILKCYVNLTDLDTIIVRTDTMLGSNGLDRDNYIIDETNKTALFPNINSTELTDTVAELESYGTYYNYFQNSNLSAWKVWYCLDNDTARFAWADSEEVVIKTLENGNLFEKRRGSNNIEFNGNTYYQWQSVGSANSFTLEEKPTINSKIYRKSGPPNAFIMVESEETIVDVRSNENGRGVIYRLIDEWNNDVAYDFKNIQHVRKLTDGEYDPDNGTKTWVYTFSYWYNDGVIDSSTEGQTFTDDAGDIAHICENTIKARNIGGKYELSNNVIYGQPDGEWYYGAKFINIDGDSNINTILGYLNISLNYSYQTIIESNAILLYRCSVTSFTDDAIYIRNKKVLTES